MFCANPKAKHTEAVERIGRYIFAAKDKGLVMELDKSGRKYWADTAYA